MREKLERYFLRGCFTDADIEADPGSGGSKFRVDDDGTRVWPYTKVVWGTSGVQNEVSAGGAALPIQDGGNSLTVDGTVTVDGAVAVTNAGTFATQVDGAALTALAKIDDPVLVDDAAFTPTTSSVSMAGFQADETATDSVDEGDAGAARMTLDRKQIVTHYAHTTGGWTPHSHISDGTNQDAEVVKASAGQLGTFYATNVNAAPAYVKFYDSAATSEETDTPVLRFLVPGNTAGAGAVLNLGAGIKFVSGLCYRITTAVADASSAGAAANEVILNLGFA